MNPTRYPLQWPVGWKRTAYRSEAKFSKHGNRLSVADGVARVMLELERLGVSENDVVISTNLQTRLDGLPRSDQSNPGDPGVCVYWQRRKQPMQCMAIDMYYRVADNLAAVAASLEAMRAIERHGGAVIMDRAFTGFTALPAPIVASMKRPWREVLGLDTGGHVTPDEVRARWKHLASVNHPDKATSEADRGARETRMADINVARDEALKEIQA